MSASDERAGAPDPARPGGRDPGGESELTHPEWTEAPHAEPAVEAFADGEILSYHGRVDGWLLTVYAALAVWGVYYLLRFWGGLGPGQAR